MRSLLLPLAFAFGAATAASAQSSGKLNVSSTTYATTLPLLSAVGRTSIQVCPKDRRALPGHPKPAVSWHSGFWGGAHCST